MRKKWVFKNPVSQETLDSFKDLHPVVVQLLSNRGVTSHDDVESFLHPDYVKHTHDPFLFQDMKKSVDRIYQAIENKEKIIVHGDYDADGVCSSAIMISTIRDLGGDVDVYIPHREKEGYGVNLKTVQHLIENHGVGLLITVDCGTANVDSIEYAQEQGVDVIITDHHHAPEVLPKSFALINPQNHNDSYPFGFLCGAGVAFKVAQALYITERKKDDPKLDEGYDKWLLDLVAVATIADMMPLNDENRALVKYGLIVLKKTKRKGLQALMEHAGIWEYGTRDITPTDVGFVIGPRLNAAGRMDHANAAFVLLMEDDEVRIAELVAEIEQTNRERKDATEKMTKEAFEQLDQIDDKYLAFVYADGWPVGLVGLVAGKILQQTGKPAVVATKLPDRIAGSGRSVEAFNMAEMLDELREYFTTAGGHAVACGFSLDVDDEKLAFVKKQFEDRAKEKLEGADLRPEITIDAVVKGSDVRWDLYDKIQELKPFGKENEEPIFVLQNLKVEDARAIGNENKHLKLRLQDPTQLKSFSAVAFGFGDIIQDVSLGTSVDIAFVLDSNEWNGNKELQLKITDIEIKHD